MMPGMNQQQMKQMMKQFGMQMTEIPAEEVIIRSGRKEIVITNPQVSRVKAMGQDTFQVVGQVSEREVQAQSAISEDDVSLVMEQTGKPRKDARDALEASHGDIAGAILKLKE